MDPDPALARAPDPDPSIKQNIKKNLDSYCFVTSFGFLSLKNDVNVLSKVFCWRDENSRIRIH
jgi:hypothetical protein